MCTKIMEMQHTSNIDILNVMGHTSNIDILDVNMRSLISIEFYKLDIYPK